MGAFVVVLGAWLAIPPSHDRDWQPDMATLPYADIRFPNGYLDELGYENGALDQSMPFAALKARSHINECARAADGDPRFSVLIRAGLPRMPESSGA